MRHRQARLRGPTPFFLSGLRSRPSWILTIRYSAADRKYSADRDLVEHVLRNYVGSVAFSAMRGIRSFLMRDQELLSKYPAHNLTCSLQVSFIVDLYPGSTGSTYQERRV